MSDARSQRTGYPHAPRQPRPRGLLAPVFNLALGLALSLATTALLLAPVVGAAAGDPTYNHTISCSSFTRPSGWTVANSCDLEGDFSPIIARPTPASFQDRKLGIFLHWGVYSVPSYGNEWYWHNLECGDAKVAAFHERVYGKNTSYLDLARLFKAELFDADEWLALFKRAGASYILPVGKHHDGFAMWDARQTTPGWNAAEVGPQKPLLELLYNASLRAGLDFGIYFSQGEWFNADMVADANANFTTQAFIARRMAAQRDELIAKFNKAVLWHTDGGWFAPDSYWGNLAWLNHVYSPASGLTPAVGTCNSMGFGCHVTYPQTPHAQWEYGDAPSGGDRTTAGALVPHFYTNQMTIQRSSWSWDRSEMDLADFLTADDLLRELVSTTAWNGTLIINVGPTAAGQIPPIFQDRLLALGGWLDINNEAIHGSRPWAPAAPAMGTNASVFYTRAADNSRVFAICLGAGAGGREASLQLDIPRPGPHTAVTLLVAAGKEAPLPWKPAAGAAGAGIVVDLAGVGDAVLGTWTIVLRGLANM